MTKTIEDLAREYVNDIYSGDTDFIDETENILSWLFDKPLSQRLTAEEKERVRTKYNAAKIGATEFDSPECADLMDILEDIFGADFFKEGE